MFKLCYLASKGTATVQGQGLGRKLLEKYKEHPFGSMLLLDEVELG